ncbi:MAG: hypothetical protein K2X81_13215 [Candidatus Obscuribacterales bacterium]|nr:hypothetical protein [Candidatus Obscuribacterales bacterium]
MAKPVRREDNPIRRKGDNHRLNEKARLENKSITHLLDEGPKIKIGDRNRIYLEDISQKTGKSMNDVLNQIIAEQEENCIFDGLKDCYSELRQDETAWQNELDERENWRGLIADRPDNLENE